MEKNKDRYKYIPMVISKYTYIDMQEQIKQAEDGTMAQCNLRNKMEKDFKEYKESQKEIIKFKDKKISDLESKIKEYEEELNTKVPKKITRTLNAQKGGYTKEINKLTRKIDAKERVIEEYKIALEKAEKKNDLQAAKIRELTSNQKHSIEEYQQDGLPQQTKKTLKNIKRKGDKNGKC